MLALSVGQGGGKRVLRKLGIIGSCGFLIFCGFFEICTQYRWDFVGGEHGDGV